MLKEIMRRTVAVKSDRSRIYLQRSQFENITYIFLLANPTKSVKAYTDKA